MGAKGPFRWTPPARYRDRIQIGARRYGRRTLSVAWLVVRTLAFAVVARVLPARRRDPSIWVFGARGGDGFVDNSKYLFLHVANERPEVRAVWLSKDDEVVVALRSRGYEAYHASSPRGAYLNLRAGVVVLSQGPGDVNLACSGGASIVQLWHGVPLKSIGLDAEISTRSLPERLVYAHLVGQTTVVITSLALVEPFESGYGVGSDRLVVTGYPRLDALFGPVPGEDVGLDARTAAEVRRIASDHTVIAYLPTFRDVPANRASAHLDFDALQRFLEARDAYLIVKFHPFEDVDDLAGEHSRIVHVPSGSDPYPLLRHVDLLVTDYSSVAFDFLLLDRPTVYYPYDLDRYRRDRGFYFEYEAVTPGPVATDFQGLLGAIGSTLDRDEYLDRRRAVRDRFFRFVDDGQAALVYRTIRELLGDP